MAITPNQWSHVLTIPESYTPSAATSGQTLVITESVIAKLSAGDQATFWSNVANGGGDVRICTDSGGVNQLPVEVVSLDNVAQTCVIWTRKPTYNGTGNLYVFIGKAGETQPPVTDTFGRNAVWQDFEYCFHFSSAGELVDSAGNHSLTEFGIVNKIAGQVGDGADAVSDNANYHNVTGYKGPTGGVARTHSMWFNAATSVGLLEYGTSATAQRYTVRIDGGRFRTEIAGSFTRTNDTTLADGAWHRAVTKEDGSGTFPSGNTLSVDGVVQAVNSGSNISLNTTPNIDLAFHNSFALNANEKYDEYSLRLFETTDALDATEYNNQSGPASFYGTPTLATTGGATGVTADAAYTIAAPTFTSSASVTLPQPIANASFTIGSPTFTVSADATLPQPVADGAFSIASPTFSADATATLPQPIANAAFTINAPTFAATASATIPGFSASVSFAIPAPTFAANATVTLPSPTADVSYTIAAPTFSVNADATLPQPSSDVAFTVNSPSFAVTATATEPGFNASVNFTVNAPTFSVDAAATLPQPSADVGFTVSAPTFSVVAIVGGIAIIVDNETNINVPALATNINAPVLSNNMRI